MEVRRVGWLTNAAASCPPLRVLRSRDSWCDCIAHRWLHVVGCVQGRAVLGATWHQGSAAVMQEAGHACVRCVLSACGNCHVRRCCSSPPCGVSVCLVHSRLCSVSVDQQLHCWAFRPPDLPFRASWPVSRQPTLVLAHRQLCRGPAIPPCIAPMRFLSQGQVWRA